MIERLFIIILVIYFSRAFMNLHHLLRESFQELSILMAFLSTVALFKNRSFIKPNIIFILLIIFFISIVSADFIASLEKIISLVISGLAISALLSFKNVDRVKEISLICCSILIISIPFSILFPNLGPQDTRYLEYYSSTDAWKGVFVHKNEFGNFISLAILLNGIQIYYKYLAGKSLKFELSYAALCILLLFKSQSVTSIFVSLCLLLYLTYFIFINSYHKRVFYWTLTALVSILIFFNTFSIIEWIIEFSGKDISLTGRVPLWEVLIGEINVHPWFGYGYGVYWDNLSTVGSNLLSKLTWIPYSSHNTLIDMVINIGVVGFVLFLPIAFSVCRAREFSVRIMAVYIVTISISESYFAIPNSVYWMILYILTGSIPSLTFWRKYDRKTRYIDNQLQ